MAFQTGTKVDPRLMMADYSGFAKAAEIEAQGMKNFAESIGGGIAKFAKKKEQKKKEETGVAFATEWATNNPEMAQAMGFDVTDDDGFFDATNIEKSAREFYKTVGDDGFKSVIPQLLALGVKSDSAAAERNKQSIEELKDLEGFRKITGYVDSLDDLRIMPSTAENSTGGSFVLERKIPGAFNLKDGVRFPRYETVQYDDPEAAMIAGRPGSYSIFGSTGVQMSEGQFPGARIPRRPEVPVGDTSNPVPPTVDPNDPGGLF
jgi:hypothetical protein